jgi:AraC-like DNA-binding protein
MTHKGEQVTAKGEFYEGAFNTKQHLSISFFKRQYPFTHSDRPDDALDLFSFKMIFVLKGNISYNVGGSEQSTISIGNQQHNLVAIPKRAVFKSVDETGQSEIVVINLSASFLSRYLPAANQEFKNAFTSGITKPTLFFDRNLYLNPEISAILNTLENSSHTGFCKSLFLESKVIELLVLQMSQFELAESEQIQYSLKKDEQDRMQEVKEILMSNIDSQLSLRTLAHMVGTNEFNLKRNFKAAFGTTVYGYFNQYKMEQAKAMLIEGDAKVAEVSGKMGYKHATHFTTAFKKYFGYLPTKIKMSVLLIDPEFCLFFFTA